ncbi:hypothetical protein Sango_2801700 [Sesamum angolense]|uniref:SWIM-type domain-containing protein n=1 Tax=Sesamum angolense TaxID=2727404 RepID=A0AAE1T763_9LAMI|nr:hypothetical protein Sango_2801700 [Sesamum angolense]
MVVPDDPAVSEWGTYMSMLTQELSSVPVVTQSMGRFGINDDYPGPSSYASPSDYAGPSSFAGLSDYASPSSFVGPSDYAGISSHAGPSVSNEQDDEPEADSFLNNEHVDSEPDQVEVEGLTTNNPENNDEVSIEVMIDVLGNNANGPTNQRQDHFDLNMPVACEPTNLYSVIPFFEAMHAEKLNPGTVVEWLNLDTDRPGVQMLHYVFWAFRPCIEGFRWCRNVISVDGTHLYMKYKHKLLVAVTLDVNQLVLPLAFALVDEESLASWRWFLEMLAKHLLPNDDDRVCLISDRHSGLISGINYVPAFKFSRGVHRFCLQHGSHTYVVKLKHKTCSCGKWGTHGIPCSHAIQTLNLCIIRRYELAEDHADMFRRGYQMKWIDHKHVLANNINLVKFRINVITL